MLEIWDFAVIGGGAAGMAAAISAAACGDHVLLLEKSHALGRKISASGNGRCNLMNSGKLQYYGEPDFAEKVFSYCNQNDLFLFWQKLGLFLSEESDNRLYPFTFKSSSVIEVLKNTMDRYHVKICLQTAVTECFQQERYFQIITDKGIYYAHRVLIAAGGEAQPRLGGTDMGYRILKSFGHTILPVFPSLCPILTDTRSISGLSGIRVRSSISLFDQNEQLIREEKGEVLFTENGISGICAMQLARFISGNSEKIILNFTDRLDLDHLDLIGILKRRRYINPQMTSEKLLAGILLPKLSYAVMKQAGIPLRGETLEQLNDQQLQAVADKMCHYTLQVKGLKGLEDAQVTAGGVQCCEFNPETMSSLLIPGLFAAGEVLNVDGACGGFNLMFAFASGILAGNNRRKGMIA